MVDDDATRADLLIALGDVLHRTGDPAHRAVLIEAADLARALGDGARLGQAAVALNSWGYPGTTLVVDEPVRAAAADAVGLLGPEDPGLRARLLTVVAVESRWEASGADRAAALARDAVGLARDAGDPVAEAAALAGRYAVEAMDPVDLVDAAARLGTLASELADPAVACQAALMGIDAAVQLGHRSRVAAGLAALDLHARQTGTAYFHHRAAVIRAGLAILSGQLGEAERLAVRAVAEARSSGIDESQLAAAEATLRFAIRLDKGQADEAVAALETIAPFAGEDPSFRGSIAVASMEAGDLGAARRHFEAAAANGFEDVPATELGVAALVNLGRVSPVAGDAASAALLDDRLRARAGLLSWITFVSLGPVDLARARCAVAMGRTGAALDHLAEAATLCERAAARPWLARVELERAQLLVASGHRDRALAAARRARAAAAVAGMVAVERDALAVIADLLGDGAPGVAAPSTP